MPGAEVNPSAISGTGKAPAPSRQATPGCRGLVTAGVALVWFTLQLLLRSWGAPSYVVHPEAMSGPRLGTKAPRFTTFTRAGDPALHLVAPEDFPALFCFLSTPQDAVLLQSLHAINDDIAVAAKPPGMELILSGPITQPGSELALRSFEVTFDETGEIFQRYRIFQSPTIVLVDRQGLISHIWSGPELPAAEIIAAWKAVLQAGQ